MLLQNTRDSRESLLSMQGRKKKIQYVPFEGFLFWHYPLRAFSETARWREGWVPWGGNETRAGGGKRRRITRSVSGSCKLRNADPREDEGSLINAKCTIPVCYGLRDPLFTTVSLNFGLYHILRTTATTNDVLYLETPQARGALDERGPTDVGDIEKDVHPLSTKGRLAKRDTSHPRFNHLPYCGVSTSQKFCERVPRPMSFRVYISRSARGESARKIVKGPPLIIGLYSVSRFLHPPSPTPPSPPFPPFVVARRIAFGCLPTEIVFKIASRAKDDETSMTLLTLLRVYNVPVSRRLFCTIRSFP
ncbi:hypothetical protein HZH68_007504 [Vespula germanica]|uniref:Uncharacterized protein n=1 Tax=Vespula germanica TaxID=30212 RepID=A0A834KB72_VESGE|nr:hypothetical protein HZH68_007504 [Vespula germanica]